MEKKTLFFIIAMGTILGSVLILVLNPPSPGQLYDIEWDLSEKDKFYYALQDNYYYLDDATSISKSYVLLENEILDIDDLAFDSDVEPDLLIHSNLMIGDNQVGYSVPVPLDIYTLTTILQSLIGSGLSELSLPELNAVHVLSSSLYTVFTEKIETLPQLEDFTENMASVPIFGDLANLLDLANSFIDLDLADYRFAYDNLTEIPEDFQWLSQDQFNNSIQVKDNFENVLGRMVELIQNGTQLDENILSWSAIDVLLRQMEAPPEIVEMKPLLPLLYEVNTTRLSWYYQINDTTDDETIFRYIYPYDYFTVSPLTHHIGENGINFKISDNKLYYFQGNNTWNGTGYDSTSEEWLYFDDLDIHLTNDTYWQFALAFGDNYYSISITDYSTMTLQKFENIPYCMYDVVELSNIQYNNSGTIDVLVDSVFDPNNWHVFQIIQNSTNADTEYFDSMAYQFGEVVKFEGDESLSFANALLEEVLLTLSFYHILIYPTEFNLDRLGDLFTMLEGIYSKMEDLLDDFPAHLFVVENEDSYLELNINIDALLSIFDLVTGALDAPITFVSQVGDWEADLVFRWDKENHIFQSALLTMNYTEINVQRITGMKLICTTMDDDYPDEIPTEYSLIAGLPIGDLASSYVNQLIADNLGWIILGLVGFVGINYGVTIGLNSAIKKIRK